LVVAILGVLKAVGAYVPLDRAYPPDRLAFMIGDVGGSVLLTQERLETELPATMATSICLDRDWSMIAGESAEPPACAVAPAQLAYIIYTSGSTGTPKGVQITHANVLRLFHASDAWFHFDRQDVWTLFHSYAFDFS